MKKLLTNCGYFGAALFSCIFGCTLFFSVASACVLPSDTIQLYENGRLISDNSVMIESLSEDGSRNPFGYCADGICSLDSFEDVNFFKLKDSIDDDKVPEYNYDYPGARIDYFESLKKNAVYKYEYRHDPNYRGDCGDTRNLSLDLREGRLTKSLEDRLHVPREYIVLSILSVLAVVTVSFVLLAFKKYVKK